MFLIPCPVSHDVRLPIVRPATGHAAESGLDVDDARKVPPIRKDGSVPGFRGITVDAADGSRWELALTLISAGEASVMLGEVEISRNVAGPDADGVIRMMVTVAQNADREVGLTALLHGRQVADETASNDQRFARLLDEYGCR
jgi:hypothetical protein